MERQSAKCSRLHIFAHKVHNLSKSFFSKHFNGNPWQAYVLMISILNRYSVPPFYPEPFASLRKCYYSFIIDHVSSPFSKEVDISVTFKSAV